MHGMFNTDALHAQSIAYICGYSTIYIYIYGHPLFRRNKLHAAGHPQLRGAPDPRGIRF